MRNLRFFNDKCINIGVFGSFYMLLGYIHRYARNVTWQGIIIMFKKISGLTRFNHRCH